MSGSDADIIKSTAQQHEEMILRHLDLALKQWMSLLPDIQRETWQLEIARAFAREAEKRKKVEDQLARIQQEVNQLRAQVEKLESCQWPREFAIFPPDMLPLSADVTRELNEKDSMVNRADATRWEYENVLAKWKRVVMHDKSMGRAGGAIFSNTSVETSGSDNRGASNHSRTNRPGVKMSSPQELPLSRQRPFPLNQQQATPHQTGDPNEPWGSHRPAKRQRTLNGRPKGIGRADSTDASATVSGAVGPNRESHHHQPSISSGSPSQPISSTAPPAALPPPQLLVRGTAYQTLSLPANPSPSTSAESHNQKSPSLDTSTPDISGRRSSATEDNDPDVGTRGDVDPGLHPHPDVDRLRDPSSGSGATRERQSGTSHR
jgi:hypothetical protein